ncbi:chondroitinase-B domain-containing protein [Verrucomicrobiota bacterium]
MTKKTLIATSFLSALIFGQLNAAEYFVNRLGNNANDGLSREKAFLTVQKGVDALQAGDTLTIGPGEYCENVKRTKLGEAGKDTIIRSEIRGTVLLRGDVEAPKFTKLKGYRFVYVTDFSQPVMAVNEVDTLMTMGKRTNINQLEYQPGNYHYDAAGKKLYISTTDLQPPDRHFYTVSVIRENGLYLEEPCRVIVDGLAFTGFNTDKATGWGSASTKSALLMVHPVQCVIRHCVAFLNSAGLVISIRGSGMSNLIEKCVAYGNYSSLNGEGCNIQILSPDNDTIRDCYGYLGRDHNISMYGRVKNPDQKGLIKNCLAWGAWLDIQQKCGGSSRWMAENCVALNTLRSPFMKNCVFGFQGYHNAPALDKINLKAHWKTMDREFADPDNLDFRLQGTSQFRGKGTNGCDLGAFQYQTNIYYVSSGGSNQGDGLSVKTAWKTVAHAVKKLKSGDTLYLEPGVYTGGSIVGVENITIRGRGTKPVRIEGKVEMKNCTGISMERLNFSDKFTVTQSLNISWKNCTFAGLEADRVDTLKAVHGVFITAPELKACKGIYLSGNIYAAGIHVNQSEITYSDYNSYPDAAALKAMPDKYSHVIKPEIKVTAGVPVLINAHVFGGRGPNGTALGLYHEFRKKPFPVKGPFMHSVSATTANLEWWTSQEGMTEIAWGDTLECINTQQIVTACYNTYSLTGLQPGKQYYFRINSIKAKSGKAFSQIMEGIDADLKPVSLKTAATVSEPKTYYVATDGKVENTGLSRDQAWPTIGDVVDRVNAGDTVLIAGGTYREIVQIRATGDKDRPITFKSLPGEKVILDGDKRLLSHAFSMRGKDYLVFDGLYFTGHGYGSAMVMSNCRHIQVRRCFFRREGAIRAKSCSDLLIENCVIRGAMEGVNLQACLNTRYEHNVSFVHLIMHGQIVGGRAYCANNIFTDSQIYKLRVTMFIINRTETLHETNNCYFLRIPDAQRKMFQFYSYVKPPRRFGFFSLADYYAETGRDGRSLFCDPQFKGLVGVKVPPYKGVVDRLWTGLSVSSNILEAVGDGKPGFPPDKMPGNADFDAFFATNPEVVKRGMGLQPEKFKDFKFEKKEKSQGKKK